MIKATFGITQEPFYRNEPALLVQQAEAVEMIKIHAQHGGFSAIIGHPGVGKSVIRAHLEQLGKNRDTVVMSFTQTMHTYQPILRLLAESLQVQAPLKDIEKELVQAAMRHVQSQKTLIIVIDDAHLLEIDILRKLRLLFERFPKRHNLVLLCRCAMRTWPLSSSPNWPQSGWASIPSTRRPCRSSHGRCKAICACAAISATRAWWRLAWIVSAS